MVFGILLTKYKWWMNGRPKISLPMGLKHPFFAWYWVYNPQNINGGRMGGPKYLN
jgi:hypothetical protein